MLSKGHWFQASGAILEARRLILEARRGKGFFFFFVVDDVVALMFSTAISLCFSKHLTGVPNIKASLLLLKTMPYFKEVPFLF